MNLKEKLEEIYSELKSIKKGEVSCWQKVKKLYDKSEKTYFNAKSEEITEEIEIGRIVFFGNIHGGAYEFMKALQSGKNPPFSDKDLDFIQEIAQKAPQMLEELRKKILPGQDEDFFAEKEKEIKELEEMIKQEKEKIKKSSLSQDQKQKIASQQEEIENLKKQLAELQKQIEELKKQDSESNTKVNSPQVSQKLTTLENQKKEIEQKIEAQQEQVKKQIQQPGSKFQWWYVAVPAGVVVLIIGAVAIYWVKKRKKTVKYIM